MADMAQRSDKSDRTDSTSRTATNQALRKLDWNAKLSKQTLPGGLPSDTEGMRVLLNRIVLDVRAACAALNEANIRPRAGLIPKHGGYRPLKSFQVAEIVYDGTVIFCNRRVEKRSRTHDQMVQAARSGRQNIAEGSMASATSKKTELKLTNVAKASLEELLLDFEDYLRQRGLRQWAKDSPEALAVRNRYREYPREWFEGASPSNTLLCLTNQAIFLLKRQLERLERTFLTEGGFTERLYAARRHQRKFTRP
jgi:four helix bundle suffix protein